MTDLAIQAQDLTKFYGDHRGIEGLDLSIARGEIFGFLGPNGAGKTTTIRLLLDLMRPTRGRVSILGLDCRRDSLEVRRRVGFLPSEFHLYANLRGRALLGYLGGLGGRIDWTYTEGLVERFGLDLDRTIGALSHGNKQKLAIVLAFMHRPPLLVLDEPTTGLDPLVQQEFFALLNETRAGGGTVFLSSHNLPEVERVCDRVGGVREGRLIAVDEIAAIRRQAVRVVELQLEQPPTADAVAGIEGVHDVELDGHRLRCTVRGPIGPLIAAATPLGVVDILSREPNLEEFFLTMYPERRSGHARQRLSENAG